LQAKPARVNAFDRLLKDATNQIRSEYDSKLAIDMTVNDALSYVEDWKRQTADEAMAAELAKTLEEEENKSKKEAVSKGEAAALRLAIDETRRVKADAKEREAREKEDADFAKSLYEAEEKDAKLSEKIAEEDAKLARQLSGGCDSSVRSNEDCKAQEKESSSPAQDFRYPARAGAGAGGSSGECKHAASDAKGVSSHKATSNSEVEEEDEESFVREVSRKFELLSADEAAAARDQAALDAAHAAEVRRQQVKDYQISRRLAVQTEREAHRARKYKDMQQSFERCQRGHEAVARLWENAEAEVEDVCDAVCITLLLPNIVSLSVKAVRNGKKVSIEARRLVAEGGDRFASEENTQYLAEFKIQGRNVQIADSALQHDYSSDSGLLHIYIEGVSLQDNAAAEEAVAAASASASASGKMGGAESSASSKEKSSRAMPTAQDIAKAMKSGFMRILGGGSSRQDAEEK
jgi:hypothetical protein